MAKNKGNFLKSMKNFSVNKYSKFTAFVPLVILLVAIVVVVALGTTGVGGVRKGSYTDAVGIGIDFEGGTILTVTLGEEVNTNYEENSTRIINTIESFGVQVSNHQKQTANNPEQNAIQFRYKNISNNDDAIRELNEDIRDAVDALYPERPYNVYYESIGATAASDLLNKAGIALAVSVALILVYIIIRFTLMSGFAAIIALLHDVVIMFCLTVICRIQINTSYVAAMITIIAYSINNTIIIFDRCREYLKPLKKAQNTKNIDYAGIGDMAVRDTFTRSVYTTLTTMVTVIFLAILGGETIRQFCVPIILGLVAGFFSSVFLAAPLWAAMSASFDKTKEKYAKRNEVSYEKKEEGEEQIVQGKTLKQDTTAKELQQKPQQKQDKPKQNNTVYKYSKKNTQFKKKK